jgi:hypothetical protein
MFFKTFFVSAALLLSVRGQVSNPALEIEGIEAHFKNAGLVPSLLASFNPTAVLSVNYGGVGAISDGQKLTKDQVGPTPVLTLTPANSTVKFEGNYTLAMVDAGPVGSDQSAGQTRHWLVNGLTIGSDGKISNSSAIAITNYAGPAPPSGSGPHRYCFLLYAQPAAFAPPQDLSQPNVGVSVFNVNDYAKNSGLGAIIAGNYITVEEGTATASLSPTSAVVSSTLPAVSATGTSKSGSGSGSSTGASSGSTPKPSSSAGMVKSSPMVLAIAAALGFAL